MSTAVACRKAAKARRCEGCGGTINRGDQYLMHTIFPGHDVVDVDTPQQSPECSGCATRYGRGKLVGTLLDGQLTIDDLLEGGDDDAVHEATVQ